MINIRTFISHCRYLFTTFVAGKENRRKADVIVNHGKYVLIRYITGMIKRKRNY